MRARSLCRKYVLAGFTRLLFLKVCVFVFKCCPEHITHAMEESTESRDKYIQKHLKRRCEKSNIVQTSKTDMKDADYLDRFAMDDELTDLIACNEEDTEGVQNPGTRNVLKGFAIKLLLENIDRLTALWNDRYLPSLSTHFPLFVQSLTNRRSFFAQEAEIPCEMRGCDDDELVQEMDSYQIRKQEDRDEYIRIYGAFRTEMRKKRVLFKPATSELVGILARELEPLSKHKPVKRNAWHLLPLPQNNPVLTLFHTACRTYMGGDYEVINNTLRCIKEDEEDARRPRVMSEVLPALLFPFTTTSELVVYRADDLDGACDVLNTKGFFSTSLSYDIVRTFDDSRILQITIPPGTPFMPTTIINTEQAEIVLLPGTRLELVTATHFIEGGYIEGGIFAEYVVASNPPEFTDVEVVTILRAAISYRKNDFGQSDNRPLSDVPDKREQRSFIHNLVNSKYGGDW